MKTTEITKIIEQNATALINNIDVESIELYTTIKNEFENSDVSVNTRFQHAYRKFHGMDHVGFNEDFTGKYFKLLEKYRNHIVIDSEKVFIDLDRIKNFEDNDALLFSFATKLMCTIDDSIPIYDKEVCVDFAMVIDILMDQFEILQAHFNEIVESNLLPVSIRLFDEKFKGNNLSLIKKLDFIFWSFGRLKILETHIDELKVLN